MIKYIFSVLFLLIAEFSFAQQELLANNLYEKGEFEKAQLAYEDLNKSQPNNPLVFSRLIDCYQQLKKFTEAEKLLRVKIDKQKQYPFLVDLGYNYQLQKETAKAEKFYTTAIEKIKENPHWVYNIAQTFEKKNLLNYALKAYEVAVVQNPNLNFDYNMALIYGQLGDLEKMTERFLQEAYQKPERLSAVQYHLSRYLQEDVNEVFKNQLRKSLLVRAQKQPHYFWNQFLSWYYIQNKEFGKSFTQLKAVVRQNPDLFGEIVDLVHLAIDENDDDAAKEIAAFILDQIISDDLRLSLQQYLLENELQKLTPKDYAIYKNSLEQILQNFGFSTKTLDIQLIQARFYAFNLQQPEVAVEQLKKILTLPLNTYQQAQVKMELADILVFQEKFNQALVYYAQTELDLKNDALGHEASLRVAKTSYYKGDFDWALKQLKVLKASASQLIANDALELFLLINDHIQNDSTQVALKKMALADFNLYKKNHPEAKQLLNDIITNHSDDPIVETAYIRLGKIHEFFQEKELALAQYQKIIEKYPESIYTDEALFFSALIYEQMLLPEKAQLYFEKVILEHADSIYFNEAQMRFRQLRGDKQS